VTKLMSTDIKQKLFDSVSATINAVYSIAVGNSYDASASKSVEQVKNTNVNAFELEKVKIYSKILRSRYPFVGYEGGSLGNRTNSGTETPGWPGICIHIFICGSLCTQVNFLHQLVHVPYIF
jgi:hypothetical protein